MEIREKVYTIPMKPTAWKRPGLNGKVFYNTQSRIKTHVELYLLRDHGQEPPFTRPIHIDITFFMELPRRRDKKPNTYHFTRPDIDNLIKLYLDAAQPCIFKDDCIISSLSAKKIYDRNPRVCIRITEIQ